jgi:hypothetical protein
MPPAEVIIATAVLLGMASLARLLTRSWLSPGAFFGVIWTFIIVLSLSAPLFGAPQYPVWHGAIWWINLQIGVLMLGDIVGQSIAGGRATETHQERRLVPEIGLRYPIAIIIFCTVATIVYFYMWDDLMGRSQQPPLYMQLVLTFQYVGALFGGMLFGCATRTRIKVAALLMLAPGLFVSLFAAGRTSGVAHFTFWFAGYFAMLLYIKARPIGLFTKGRVIAAVAVMSLFFVIGIVIKPFRSVPRGISSIDRYHAYVEVLDEEAWDDSWEYMKPGFFGHVSAFSWYFETAWQRPPEPRAFGERTMNGLYRLLGLEIAPEYHVDVGGIDTNVFTIFGPLIMDYTLFGSTGVFFLIGIVAGWAFARILRGTLWPIAVLLVFYTNSMIAGGWYFNYNSVTFSFLFILLYLIWFKNSLHQPADGTPRQPGRVARLLSTGSSQVPMSSVRR